MLLPAARRCIMCERCSQQEDEQQMREVCQGGELQTVPKCSGYTLLSACFPPLDIIAECDSALSLCYHGEGTVAGRGHVVN